MQNNQQLALIALVTALGLLGVVAITIVTIPLQQQAEARGCPITSPGVNASAGRCFHP
jgi:Flp pilus assembly protein CpaB